MPEKIIVLLKYILVAFVQGVGEILPISSSGHMVIVQRLLGLQSSDLVFEVFLHFASLIAIIFFFRKKLWSLIKDFFLFIFKRPNVDSEEYLSMKKNYMLAWYIVIASIPAAIFGFLLSDLIEEKLSNLLFVGIFLFVTALLLFGSTLIKRGKQMEDMKWYNALFIGLFQCLGIMPGISRSGSCIVGGASQRLEQSDAAEFAFLLAIPIMLGSAVFKVSDIGDALKQTELIIPYIVAFIVTLVVTYFSLRIFLTIVRKIKLSYFSIYCCVMGLISIVLYFVL